MGISRYHTNDIRVKHCRTDIGLIRTNIMSKFSVALRTTIAGLVFLLNGCDSPTSIERSVAISLHNRIAM